MTARRWRRGRLCSLVNTAVISGLSGNMESGSWRGSSTRAESPAVKLLPLARPPDVVHVGCLESATRMKSARLACVAWLVASCPSWADSQEDRFVEFKYVDATTTYDLSTVQMIAPGRFTIISTRIDDP